MQCIVAALARALIGKHPDLRSFIHAPNWQPSRLLLLDFGVRVCKQMLPRIKAWTASQLIYILIWIRQGMAFVIVWFDLADAFMPNSVCIYSLLIVELSASHRNRHSSCCDEKLQSACLGHCQSWSYNASVQVPEYKLCPAQVARMTVCSVAISCVQLSVVIRPLMTFQVVWCCFIHCAYESGLTTVWEVEYALGALLCRCEYSVFI